MFEKEQKFSTISLYKLVVDFLADEMYRKLTADEYKRLISLIRNPASPEDKVNDDAVEYLIDTTAVNSTTNLHWTLPSGSLREFVSQYKGGRQVYLCRQKLMDSQTAKDVIALICQQPPAFR